MSLHDDGLTRAYRFAQSCAVTEHSRGRGDEERQWLDVLALLDLARHPEPAASKPTAEQVLTIAEGLRKRFAVSNGTQVWVEFQGSAEALADEIADIFTQLQVQAPVGEGLENDVSDGERRWMIATLDAVDVEHDFDSGDIPSTTTYVDALIAAGYRKAPVVLPKVEDVERVIYECIVQGGGNEEHFAFVKGGIFRHAARHVLALFNPKEES